MGNAPLPVKSLPVEKRRGRSLALRSNQGGGLPHPDTRIDCMVVNLTLKYGQASGPKVLTVHLFAAESLPPVVALHG